MSIFDFNGATIRVIEIDNTPWFVAADVCKALDIANTASSVASSVDSIYTKREKLIGQRGLPTIVVTEAGLYELVMQSRKPEAQAFRSWVTGTVLPAIRKIVTPDSPSAQQEAAGVALRPTSTTPLQIPSGRLYGTTQRL